MGMYTQLVLGCSIEPDSYQEIQPILDYMLGNIETEPEKLPDHPFFKCERWSSLLMMDSHYFDYSTHSQIETYDYTDDVNLTIVSNLKNYSHEIQKFLDWIDPYLDNWEGEFLGFMRHEEENEPTLIYKGPLFKTLREQWK